MTAEPFAAACTVMPGIRPGVSSAHSKVTMSAPGVRSLVSPGQWGDTSATPDQCLHLFAQLHAVLTDARNEILTGCTYESGSCRVLQRTMFSTMGMRSRPFSASV